MVTFAENELNFNPRRNRCVKMEAIIELSLVTLTALSVGEVALPSKSESPYHCNSCAYFAWQALVRKCVSGPPVKSILEHGRRFLAAQLNFKSRMEEPLRAPFHCAWKYRLCAARYIVFFHFFLTVVNCDLE